MSSCGVHSRALCAAHSAAACLSVPLSMGHSAAAAGLAGSNPLSAMPQLRTGMPSLQTERHCRASLRAAWAPAEQQWKHGSSRSRQQRTAARAVAAWQRIKPFRALTTSAEEAVEALPPAEHRRTTRGGLRTPPSLRLAVHFGSAAGHGKVRHCDGRAAKRPFGTHVGPSRSKAAALLRLESPVSSSPEACTICGKVRFSGSFRCSRAVGKRARYAANLCVRVDLGHAARGVVLGCPPPHVDGDVPTVAVGVSGAPLRSVGLKQFSQVPQSVAGARLLHVRRQPLPSAHVTRRLGAARPEDLMRARLQVARTAY
eukprot:scaffold10504_cov67-Phaeocystis_antarctica.AAC.4